MRARNLVWLVAGVVAGVALAGAAASAVSGVGPVASWMGHGGCRMCGSSAPTVPGGTMAGGTVVPMQGNEFHPLELQVKVGQTVTWRNDDKVAHTVTSDEGREMDSPLLAAGATWSHAFTQPGTYRYHCGPHAWPNGDGSWGGMVGTIVVT